VEAAHADECHAVRDSKPPSVFIVDLGDLHVPPDHVHATVADNDIIKQSNNSDSFDDPISRATDVHGPDPADPRIGGRVFASDPGTPGWPFGSQAAHSEYWDQHQGGLALANMGRIIAGKPTV
jgi:hypothetical protein